MSKIKIKPSVIFWNSVVFLTIVISAFINIEVAGIELFILTMASFPILLDYASDAFSSEKTEDFPHYWIYLSAFTWFFIILYVILRTGHWIWENVIQRINDWIDTKFSKE